MGYNSLASKISEKFESVKVFSRTAQLHAEGNNRRRSGLRLGIDGAVISEPYLEMKLSPEFSEGVHYAYSGDGGFDIRRAFISYGGDWLAAGGGNNARCFGTECENLAVHFSKMIVLAEGQFSVGDELIAGQQPDYIITIRSNGEIG